MRRFRLKRKRGRRIRKRIVIISGVIVFIAFMFIFGKNGVVTLVKMRNQIAELKMEIKSKHQQIEQLKEEINALKSDPVYIESQARRAGMLKNGEQIVKFVSKEKIADR